ncbi:MAG: hypothetical protein H6702_04545 [Myxococcales bacterium]|nr:hypothetical protein [Myxococcales bacterium]
MKTRLGLALLSGVLLVAVGAPAAQAQGPELKVSVVHALKKPGPKDPALSRVQGKLEKTFAGYKSFKELAKHQFTLGKGGPATLKLPNKKDATFDYKGKNGTTHKVAMTIGKNTFNLAIPEKRLFFQAGLKHEGGILVLALYLK